MPRRGDLLEFAALGVLHDSPLHGYELRKRLNGVLGTFRAISYGSLYPCLKSLVARGLLVEQEDSGSGSAAMSRRARIVYALTPDGKEYFAGLLGEAGPDTWEDEPFTARLAFFGQTDAAVRLRILQGRRSRLEERLSLLRSSLGRTRERMDTYTQQLQQHGLDSVEREVRWLTELIEHEMSDSRTTSSKPTRQEPEQNPEGTS